MKVKIYLEIEVDVDGKYYPADPGKWTLSNGDPGYPPTPAEYEINKVMWGDLDITDTLSEEDLDYITEVMLDEAE